MTSMSELFRRYLPNRRTTSSADSSRADSGSSRASSVRDTSSKMPAIAANSSGVSPAASWVAEISRISATYRQAFVAPRATPAV